MPTMTVPQALDSISQAAKDNLLSPGAVENVTRWLKEDRYSDYLSKVLEHIEAKKWKALDDAFWTVIPFGTGGRRGRMYEIGSNAINDRTIGESAQGLADYVKSVKEAGATLRCAIAYDTRHRSRHFAELCASIMVANGFEVFFLDDYRATPQLSFAVRSKECDCGIMVTASHNPPSDNAVKVYWSTGGQVMPPHDAKIIDRVMSCQAIHTVPFDKALSEGKVKIITKEIDRDYLHAAVQFAWKGPRDIRILYSPLHGVGGFAVMPLLKAAGFNDVVAYAPHWEPSGDFPNVPGHVSNPENTIVFEAPIENAKLIKADIVIATDPDCDRLGCAAPLTTDLNGPWATLNGNQMGAILADYVLCKMEEAGTLTPKHYIIKTLVTTDLTRLVAEHHGIRCEGNIHVGFKWIAGLTDAVGPEYFAFGTEESHGYTIGTYARDKDGAVACLLMAQLAADCKSKGISLHHYLDQLFLTHGYHMEDLLNVQMEGSEGMINMKRLMQAFRTTPPKTVGGLNVAAIRDYKDLSRKIIGGEKDGQVEQMDAPKTDMIVLDLAEPGNYVAVRPSGTEPKVKFYFFSRLSPAESVDLPAAKDRLQKRLATYRSDIQAYAKSQ